MLTKQDLKNIGDLIDTKLESKLEEKLESKLEEKLESKLAPIYNELKMIKSDVKNLQKDMTVVKKDVKTVKKIIEKDFGYHEAHNIHVVKNVQQIQRNLGIPIMAIDPPLNNFV